ncbi:Kinetochore-associated protein, partial [Lachnellula suecica]
MLPGANCIAAATMSTSNNSDVTLLTEHLTYRPAALIDDIVNSINILAFKAIDAVERGLLAAKPSDIGFKIPSSASPSKVENIHERIKHEIENGVHQLETLLEAKIDKNFDKLELWALRNVLTVPADVRDWVRLAHHDGLNFEQARDEHAPSAESVTMQRRKLRETQKLHALLVAETARNEATIASLKALLGEKTTGAKKEEDAEVEGTYPAFAFLKDRG